MYFTYIFSEILFLFLIPAICKFVSFLAKTISSMIYKSFDKGIDEIGLSLASRQEEKSLDFRKFQNGRWCFFVVTHNTSDVRKIAYFGIRVTRIHTYRIMRHVLFTTYLCHQPNMRLNLRMYGGEAQWNINSSQNFLIKLRILLFFIFIS